MRKKLISKFTVIISVLLCFSVVFTSATVYANDTQPDAINDTVHVNFIFAFFRSKPNLSFSNIKSIFWRERNVKVLGYSGSYVYVQDLKTEEKGYIHNLLLNDKRLNIVRQYTDVYKGDTREGILTVKYDGDGDLNWSLSEQGIVEITKYNYRSLSVKGLSTGTVKLTVECNGYSDTCDIACIVNWSDTETATATSSIKVMGTPGKYYDNAKTISEGATITAEGHVPEYSDYIYVSSGDIWGFIKLSDFPEINYLMTQYHYYDQGYNLRFTSASTKIYDYASVLNDVMMANFKLKVCPCVASYTSVADECKILIDDEVSSDNLSTPCPATSGHYSGTCLTTGNVRDDLKSQFDDGGGNISKASWTGHIMTNHEGDRSNSTVGMGTIIMTPYGVNKGSSSDIRKKRIYTITHETSHQFGLHDHYCAGDKKDDNAVCSNKYCSDCNNEPIPYGCIMLETIDIEKTTYTQLYCDACRENVLSYIKNF